MLIRSNIAGQKIIISILALGSVSSKTLNNSLKWGFHGPTNRANERHKTADLLDLYILKYLVGATNLLSLPTNIDNLSIVLCSPIRP